MDLDAHVARRGRPGQRARADLTGHLLELERAADRLAEEQDVAEGGADDEHPPAHALGDEIVCVAVVRFTSTVAETDASGVPSRLIEPCRSGRCRSRLVSVNVPVVSVTTTGSGASPT